MVPSVLACPVCRDYERIVGVLCRSCSRRLGEPEAVTPEQIDSNVRDFTTAALIDPWGGVRYLGPTTRLGRLADGPTITILTPMISRQHALLSRDGQARWSIRDLDSLNGTFVDGKRVVEAVLGETCRVHLGRLGFYFLSDPAVVPSLRPRRGVAETSRPPSVARVATENDLRTRDSATLEVLEPTGGGGSVLRISDKAVQLTIAQHELFTLLLDRMQTDVDVPPGVRGFVTIEELLGRLSLDSHSADADNVRQLVRRVRRQLCNAGIGDLIESRQGLGYRLVPQLAAACTK